MSPPRVLDLFSGIGGFSLGLERAGMRTVAFCEIEPYARAVLAHHWPEVPCYDDVCALTADRLAADGIGVDVICGGFPCQDISLAGAGAGLAGERSGLWREIARLVGELRPRFVILENVAALLGRGLGDVLGQLATLGYDAEWHCIPASHVGAHHRRDRIWIVAYTNVAEWRKNGSPRGRVAGEERLSQRQKGSSRSLPGGKVTPHANRQRRQECYVSTVADRPFITDRIAHALRQSRPWIEPDVGRVAHGVPQRMDRLRCLGNAVVPQIPEAIGRAIMEAIACQSPKAALD